jgi:hypothetical protein
MYAIFLKEWDPGDQIAIHSFLDYSGFSFRLTNLRSKKVSQLHFKLYHFNEELTVKIIKIEGDKIFLTDGSIFSFDLKTVEIANWKEGDSVFVILKDNISLYNSIETHTIINLNQIDMDVPKVVNVILMKEGN